MESLLLIIGAVLVGVGYAARKRDGVPTSARTVDTSEALPVTYGTGAGVPASSFGGGGGWLSGGYPARYGRWEVPDQADPYREIFQRAEIQHGIPAGLLLRLGWQESRFNPRAINTGSNAQGMMQIVPRWHPGVDPYNVSEAVNYAAQYLASLRRQLGSWPLALAGYNWGPGNVRKYGLARAPKETRDYIDGIAGDILGVTYAQLLAGAVVA